MAERLTGKSKKGFYLKDAFGRVYCDDDKETINAYYGQQLIVKLGKLEDIMEKYGIKSIEQLQDLLNLLNGYFINTANALKIKFENFEDNIKYLANRSASHYDELYDTKIDRDTWKKACELACEVISYNMTPYAMINSLGQYEVVAHKYKNEVEENTIYLYQKAKEKKNVN